MKNTDIYKAFAEIDEDILERSEKAAEHKRTPLRRRIVIAAAAVLAVVVLMGAAAIKYYDSIQGLLGHRWESVIGTEMTKEQYELLDRYSQYLGISKTRNGVTITVDSATVGQNQFDLLILIEGIENFDDIILNPQFNYYDVKVNEDWISGMSMSEYFVDNGTIAVHQRVLFEYDADEADVPLNVELKFFDAETKIVGYEGFRETTVLGEWSFEFTLYREPVEKLELPDTDVWVNTSDGTNKLQYKLENFEITNFGVRFTFYDKNHAENSDKHLDFMYFTDNHPLVYVVLEDGAEVCVDGGSGHYDTRDYLAEYDCRWLAPIDIDKVVEIHIGDTVIPIK